MRTDYSFLEVVVVDIQELTPTIKQFTLERCDQQDFPSFTGGSHVLVQVSESEQGPMNAYSLMSSPLKLHQIQIGVRRDDQGKGGSVFMHQQVSIGKKLRITTPKNLFALSHNANSHLLIAGGIGITPFIPQLEELKQRQCHFELHYAFRSRTEGALHQELMQQYPQRVHCYVDEEKNLLDIKELLQTTLQKDPETHFYVCGPQGLMDAVVQAANTLGIASTHIHLEQFQSSVSTTSESKGFTVRLAKSNQTISVLADQTILQAVEYAGVSVECLCREGVCGTCETAILEGEAEHRDQYLSDEEKQSQNTMMICVSRAKTAELVLDL